MPMAEMIGKSLCSVTTSDRIVSHGRKQSQSEWIHIILDVCDNGRLIKPPQMYKKFSSCNTNFIPTISNTCYQNRT